ncbi:hypothetical protein ACM15_26735 [Parabacteroides goldsteinii]|uniref:Uncharacterized protein n=2 Tax=Parabacteroides goldsteinii TaxID=328812 RepID=A0A0J6CEW2_9BACT|nr:hypothetical protein [Parabacteroides goldsteinii]KMM30664.1 hypothetical protein ACM15_26735 [Parabacteroides goldsteinii]
MGDERQGSLTLPRLFMLPSIQSIPVVSKPAGWDAFHGLALAKEKLSSEEIQQQMKELGVEMEIVPLI